MGDIIVEVEGLRSADGVLIVSLLSSDPEEPAVIDEVAQHVVPIPGGTPRVRFTGVEAGSYAVSVVHDEDDSGALDLAGMGLPREGLGFTHDPRIADGMPSFDEVSFAHGRGESMVRVTVQYLLDG